MKVLVDPTTGRTDPIVLDAEPLKRGGQRAQGGEGKVYAAADWAGCVAKVYAREGDGVRHEKVKAMLGSRPRHAEATVNGQVVPLLAWPTHVLLHDDDRFAGFLMPRVPADFESLSLWLRRGDKQARGDKRQPLTPEDRSIPSRVWGCRNLARLVQSVHEQGHWVMDLNAPNIFVQRKFMKVCLIDCDGFTIAASGRAAYPAAAVKPESVAPELQHLPREQVLNAGDAQDRFALALAIFQWLNHGVHPFQGRWLGDADADTGNTIQDNLARWRYAYGLTPHPELAPMPTSDHDTFPPALRAMFDRAFVRENAATRPSAAEWVTLLQRFKQEKLFAKCPERPDDALHLHFSGMPCPRCRFEAGRGASADGSSGFSSTLSGASVTSSAGSASSLGSAHIAGSESQPPAQPPAAPSGWSAGRKLAVVLMAAALAVSLMYRASNHLWPWSLPEAPPEAATVESK